MGGIQKSGCVVNWSNNHPVPALGMPTQMKSGPATRARSEAIAGNPFLRWAAEQRGASTHFVCKMVNQDRLGPIGQVELGRNGFAIVTWLELAALFQRIRAEERKNVSACAIGVPLDFIEEEGAKIDVRRILLR